jgi:predicted dehydrogenase
VYAVGLFFVSGDNQARNIMSRKARWGVLSTAGIATRRVIPAMQKCEFAEIAAISSRSLSKAKSVAASFSIPKAYGSHEELLADPEIEVIYNPLPNHLHAVWTLNAARSGKHVLCEKPIALNTGEARKLMDAAEEFGIKIGEAFMVRTHPQWLRTRDLIHSGRIGKLRSATGLFSYLNINPEDVRNVAQFGGGALLDIGCYPIKTTRFVFGEEPARVMACIERDPSFKTDRLTSAILEYPSGQCIFSVSTQMAYYQKMHFFGTEGRIDVEIPFNAPTDKPTRIFIDNGRDLYANASAIIETVPICNQFTIQGDLFSKAVLQDGDVPNPLEDAFCNMAVIDALFRSAESSKWEVPERL